MAWQRLYPFLTKNHQDCKGYIMSGTLRFRQNNLSNDWLADYPREASLND